MVFAGVVAGSGAAAYAGLPPLRPGEFFYQFHGDVVLWGSAATSWGSGAFQLEAVPDDRHDDVLVTRAVDARRLPPALSRWLGRELRLYARDGSSCTAKIAGFRLVGVAPLVPPLTTIWNGLRDRNSDPAPSADDSQEQAAMAEAAWNHGARLLVAEVARPKECAAPAWARGAELTAPVLAADEPVAASLDQLAIDAFRALPAWQHLQQGYATAPDRRGQPEPFWDCKNHAQPRVQRFRLSSHGGDHHLVSVYAVLDDADAARDRRLWAIFELDGPPDHPSLWLRNLTSGRSVPAGLDLQSMVDLHGDGRLGLLYGANAGNGLMLEAGRALVDQPGKRAPR